MKEPSRLLSRGATDFERQLLRSVLGERPSPVLRSRMRQGLGLVGPLLWVSNVKAMFGNVATKLVSAKVTLGVAVTGLVAAGAVAGGALGSLEEAAAPPSPPPIAASSAPAVEPEPALPAAPAPATPESSELREEIALLDGARAALDRRDHERAADLLSQHALRFGKAGALWREAQLLGLKQASSTAAVKRGARRGAKEPR